MGKGGHPNVEMCPGWVLFDCLEFEKTLYRKDRVVLLYGEDMIQGESISLHIEQWRCTSVALTLKYFHLWSSLSD